MSTPFQMCRKFTFENGGRIADLNSFCIHFNFYYILKNNNPKIGHQHRHTHIFTYVNFNNHFFPFKTKILYIVVRSNLDQIEFRPDRIQKTADRSYYSFLSHFSFFLQFSNLMITDRKKNVVNMVPPSRTADSVLLFFLLDKTQTNRFSFFFTFLLIRKDIRSRNSHLFCICQFSMTRINILL